MWSIKVLNGVSAGQTFPLKNGENTIGRSQQADICLADKGVSKRHACITVEGSKLTLNDLGSSNGTFVNASVFASAMYCVPSLIKSLSRCNFSS